MKGLFFKLGKVLANYFQWLKANNAYINHKQSQKLKSTTEFISNSHFPHMFAITFQTEIEVQASSCVHHPSCNSCLNFMQYHVTEHNVHDCLCFLMHDCFNVSGWSCIQAHFLASQRSG